MRDSSLEYTCLFGGELSPQWRAVAPYLVELSPSNPYTAYLLDLAWGNSWGVFMRVADASRLRLHLKTFLRAKLADGTRVMFRYYDPRVLRAYLPTCNIDELRTVFGPVNHYLIESGDGGEVIESGLAGTQLSARRFAVNDAVEPASPEPASPC